MAAAASKAIHPLLIFIVVPSLATARALDATPVCCDS
jgi:hypothetical protein